MSEITEKISKRVDSVDFLRGLVMVIMLLDHVREYVHADAFRFSPTDLSKTNVLLFFTRWITHFCAPTFVFLAGTSVYLQKMRGKSRAELSKFLLTRGLWLIVLEITVVRFSMVFNFDFSLLAVAEVIWVIGVSMIVLAGLIYLPVYAVAIFGVLMIALHNLFDSISIPPATAFAGTPPPDALQIVWMFLHNPGVVPVSASAKIFVAYPLIPWIGVMAAGYALGVVYTWEAERWRRKFLLQTGLALTILFIVLRAINIYGDPQIWKLQDSFAFTVLSFLNVTKYPVSLLFLLMTLGPALIVLALAENTRADNILNRIFITFGRVPLFYFILQMFYAHGVGVLLGYLAGKDVSHLFLDILEQGAKAPPDAGFSLFVVYAAWLAGLILLYPLCAWYSKIKQRRRGFPFSYL